MMLEIDDEVFENIIVSWLMKEYEYQYFLLQDEEQHPEDRAHVLDCVRGIRLMAKTYMYPQQYAAFFEDYDEV